MEYGMYQILIPMKGNNVTEVDKENMCPAVREI
jgi:hypothetical protein